MPRTLSPEHKKKLAEGRARAAAAKEKERARTAKKRVDAYSKWVKDDSAYYQTPREKRRGAAPLMPVLPSKQDYIDAGRLLATTEED
jgi:hypothetical protein